MLALSISPIAPACFAADDAASETLQAPGSYLQQSNEVQIPVGAPLPPNIQPPVDQQFPNPSLQSNGYPALDSAARPPASTMSNPLQGGVVQRSFIPPNIPSQSTSPPQYGTMMTPQYGMMPPPQYNNMLHGSSLQNALMPPWLPAYMQALKGAMPPPEQGTELQGGVQENITRPDWLPMEVYTHPSMVTEYHALDIDPFDKRPIPNKPQTMRLSESVLRYWRGRSIDPTFIYSVPDAQHPGSFTFTTSNYPGGPKGWLQATGHPGKWGFPQYRYWFDPR
jgi:hypothetical protein